MTSKPDATRIALFLAFAFGIAWAGAFVIYRHGGLTESPALMPGSGLSLALVILATVYMWAPALSHVLTRLITREGWRGLYLSPRWVHSWVYLCGAWFVPAMLVTAGAYLYFFLFPQDHDRTYQSVQAMIDQLAAASGRKITIAPFDYMAVQIASAAFLAPIANVISTFGEEFGWRAYLQPKLLAFGYRKAMILTGVIWGVWHWPIIAMGYNYGLDSPGFPWAGMLAMVWFTIQLGVLFGWLTVRSRTVWPAVIAHAAVNGAVGIPFLFAHVKLVAAAGVPVFSFAAKTMPLLGPALTGLVAAIPMTALSLYLLWKPGGTILAENGVTGAQAT
jgi:membrane protease YdiL (CAAX protease family)